MSGSKLDPRLVLLLLLDRGDGAHRDIGRGAARRLGCRLALRRRNLYGRLRVCHDDFVHDRGEMSRKGGRGSRSAQSLKRNVCLWWLYLLEWAVGSEDVIFVQRPSPRPRLA